MQTAAAHRRTWPLLFAGVATGVYATAHLVAARLSQGEPRASVVAAALTIDLVVVVPLAFYLLVVRRLALPFVTVVPIVVLSVLTASRVVPDDQQQLLRVAELLAVPMELALVGWIGWRAAKAVREARRHAIADPIDRLRQAAFELTRNDRVAGVIATEVAVFWYALGSWRARADAPTGTIPFTHHRRSAHAMIVFAFILVLAIEGLAVHLLLLQWSALVAWIFTIGTMYGALWLIADYRATVLRPILVGGDEAVFRAGLRFTLEVPLVEITAVGRDKPPLGRECVSLTLLATPTHWITLSEPRVARGAYGLRRRVRAIGVAPDAGDELERLLRGRSA